MGLELLREADMILDACGRPSPPAGYRFVDLPRCIGFSTSQIGGDEGGRSSIPYPYSHRIQNTGPTLFLVRGISTNNQLNFRIKWPTGRYFNQAVGVGGGFLNGFGSNQYALAEEVPVPQGERVTIEVQDDFNGGELQVALWGVLRYLLREVDGGQQSEAGCIVGYPAIARPTKGLVAQAEDPLQVLENIPRYWCGPNQNIMAPEALLGDQAPDTPAGYYDEPYTLLSDPIVVATDGQPAQSLDNQILASGVEDVIIRRVRPISTWDVETTGILEFSIRTPSGFSVTGGDMIGSNGSFEWLPLFPPLRIRAGQRIIIDVSSVDGAEGGGDISTVFEFDCVKRRKVGQ